MSTNSPHDRLRVVPAPLDGDDLEAVLAAWNGATERLEQTHEALRAEVRRLTDELETKNRELARKNRLADLGQMASHVAHEVRNSLVPVSLYLGLLQRQTAGDQSLREIVDKIAVGVTSLDATVNDLLNFTSERDARRTHISVRGLVEEIHGSLAPQLHAQKIRGTIDVDPRLTVLADRDMLRRAILNLVLNALDAMQAGGELVITACHTRYGVEIEVADSGPGLSGEDLKRAFEPFYTTKSSGAGLGLAIVFRVAEVHGGDVQAMNCPEGGAAFTIRIPQRALEKAA